MEKNKNIEDSIMKSVMDVFKDDALEFFGVTSKIIMATRTELKTIEISTSFMDYTFLMDDGTFIHFEFQTSNRKDDLPRFLAYDANLFYKERKLVNTIVVYSAGINEKNISTNLKTGSIDYNVKGFFMNNLNGDERYENLKNKVEKGELLTKYDLLNLVFLPIMNSKKDKTQRIIESIEMAKIIEDEELQMNSLALLYAFAEKFVDINNSYKIKEVFKMTILGQLLKDEGREEGRQTLVFSVIKLLTRKFGILPTDIKEKVNASKTEGLEMIVEGILDFENLEDILKYLN